MPWYTELIDRAAMFEGQPECKARIDRKQGYEDRLPIPLKGT